MRIIVIGAGPGGYETAIEAAKRGMEVVLISDGALGGTCLNEGCIPTKTFCHYASVNGADISDLEELQEKKSEVVNQLCSGIDTLLKSKKVTLVYGRASFVDSHTVAVGDNSYSADKVIIATGSVCSSLPVPGIELALTSKEILELKKVPARLCVIGGGVIGLEFASVFSAMGSQVTVVEYAPHILPRFDEDLSKRLKQSLAKRGIAIETSSQVKSIESDLSGYVVRYQKKEEEFELKTDIVLLAAGRRPAVNSLNLDAVGVEFSPKGIKVNDDMQTSNPDIYAIGDVNGRMMLAHVAVFQGKRALNSIEGKPDRIRFDIVPSAVFTVPELASVGMTEEEAKERGIKVKALKSFYRANGKAVAMGCTEGYVKILVNEENDRIIGCHILGEHASDLIQEATVLLNFDASVSDLQNIIHAHPTLGELLQTASN